MIVIGADTHKRTHTCGAVDAVTGRVLAERTLTARARRGASTTLLRWARALDAERVWAIEDCRHVSGAFERFLVARGERIVRVAPKLMAGARRSARERGKSDSIDAVAIARAALSEGLDEPPGRAPGRRRSSTFACSSTIASGSIAHAPPSNDGCAGTCTTSGPSSRSPPGALTPAAGRIAPVASLAPPDRARADRARRARTHPRAHHPDPRTRGRARRAGRKLAPQLLAERGCGPLTAAKLIGEIAGADRFATDAKLARTGGVRADTRLLRQHQPPPPRPRRQPPAQLRAAPPRDQQGPAGPRHRRLPRAQAGRGQDPPRSAALPQAPPRPPRLATPPAATHPQPPGASTRPPTLSPAGITIHCNTPHSRFSLT